MDAIHIFIHISHIYVSPTFMHMYVYTYIHTCNQSSLFNSRFCICKIVYSLEFIYIPKSILVMLLWSFTDVYEMATNFEPAPVHLPSWGWTKSHSAFVFQLSHCRQNSFLWSVLKCCLVFVSAKQLACASQRKDTLDQLHSDPSYRAVSSMSVTQQCKLNQVREVSINRNTHNTGL